MSLLEVRSLNSYYGESHILFDVSLRVEPHEVVALLGRNGAGKSTTLNMLAGLEEVTEGEIYIDGQPVSGLLPGERDIADVDPDEVDTDLVVVTGLSGGGRSTVARALENVGFYVVDNLPQALMLDMAQLAFAAGGAARRTAMVLDVRSRRFSSDLAGAIRGLKERGFSPRVVFVDADDEVLIRRFEQVRRSHPLQGEGRLADGIAAERSLLSRLRSEADLVLDTSNLSVHQLRSKIEDAFGTEAGTRTRITVLSFGYKYGLPMDADLVVDLRFLPNPHWIPELREHTGRDADVRDYVLSQEGALEFVDRYLELLAMVSGGYRREGKRYLTLAVGCTGGKHRSVAMAEQLAQQLQADGVDSTVIHRDMGRE